MFLDSELRIISFYKNAHNSIKPTLFLGGEEEVTCMIATMLVKKMQIK